MKTLTITLTQQQYDLACLRLLDPESHLQSFAECMAHNAMQELGYQQLPDGSYDPEHVKAALTRPSARRLEDDRKAKAEEKAAAALAQKQVNDAAEADKAAVLAKQESKAQALRDEAEAEQRQLDINAAAKAMLQAAMPDLRAMVAAELQGGTKASSGETATAKPK